MRIQVESPKPSERIHTVTVQLSDRELVKLVKQLGATNGDESYSIFHQLRERAINLSIEGWRDL